MAITAKISKPTHSTLKQLTEKTGKSMQLVLEEAVELYRRELFFEELNRGVLATRKDPTAWANELEERTVLEGALADGFGEKK